MITQKEDAPAGTEASKENVLSRATVSQTSPPVSADRLHHGALPRDWQKFVALGLTEDLLPVVSDPNAVIDPESTMKDMGKTPSRFNRKGNVVGIGKWTAHTTTLDEIGRWQKDSRLGICLQTRHVRAIDVDVGDFDEATDIEEYIAASLGLRLPCRRRPNSTKFLMAFRLDGEFTKRRFKTHTDGNFVEFLANGQQFIAVGTHTSGVRYEWDGGLPESIPTLTVEEFEALWADLVEVFGSEESVTTRPGQKPLIKRRIEDINDPMATFLEENWDVFDIHNSGRMDIRCAFEGGHSTDSGTTSTSYYPAGVGGFERGHFKCLHASCAGRTDQDFIDGVGYSTHGFEVVEASPCAPPPAPADPNKPINLNDLFADLILTDEDVAKMADAEFLIDNLIVRGSLHAFVAPANGGKTTLFIHLCEELARQGLQIFYVNADANPSDLKRHQAHARSNGYFVLAPDAKAGKGPADIVAKLKALNESGNDLGDFVVILDTLKKFANMIDKSRMRAFLSLMRGLSAKGATVILLAHTNKRTEDDGKHIFEGTGDLRNDVDNLIYLESEKNESLKRQEITTRPDKVRATFEPVSYVIDFNDNRKVSRSGTTLPVLQKEERAVVDAAADVLKSRERLTQDALAKLIKERLPDVGPKKIISCLRKHATGDGRTFDIRQGEHNALLYSLRDQATEEADNLADHGQA